ncbi:hypothetical protein [Sanguibacter massiliensis]|uniref:hypothetical protein n=1 Tax=Sanguibacter massiliensis TaxID=1973217 RepID=UPI000C834D7F|nr:hypothetical protein [Sanguibacter massiliensis]
MRLVVRTARRLARPRGGLAWLVPVVAVVAVIVLLHSVVERITMPLEGRLTTETAGREAAALLGAVSIDTPGEDVAATLASARTSDPAACVELGTLMPRPGRATETIAAFELHGCGAGDLGWRVTDGRSPTEPGEIAVSRAMGLGLGESLPDGMLPRRAQIVGIVENHWVRDGHVVLLAPGTWDAFGWPEVAARYPRLTATMVVYSDLLTAETLARSTSSQDDGREAQVHTVVETASVTAGSPLVYRYPATVLLLVVTALVLGLRAPVRRRRVGLLVGQGMRPRPAAAAVHLADAVGITAAVVLASVLGAGLGVIASPIVTRVLGHDVPVLVAPGEPAMRSAGVVVALVALVALVDIRGAGRAPRPARTEPPRTTARHLGAIILAGLAVLVLLTPMDLVGVLFAVILGTAALGLVAPEIVRVLVSRPWSAPSAARLALRRVRRTRGPAAIVLASSLVAVAPATALLTLVATQVDADNAAARTAPSQGQVLYYPGDARVDAMVDDVLRNDVGAGRRIVVHVAFDADSGVLTGTDDALGPVAVLESVEDLELLLATQVDADARSVLEAGGVLWGGPDRGPRLVREDRSTVPLAASIARHVDERWARDYEGFVLTGAVTSAGGSAGEGSIVYTGLDAHAQARIPQALSDAGLDQNLVRTYRPDDPYSMEPAAAAIVTGIALLAVALLVGAARGRVASLRSQASSLSALGVPRTWVATSLASEIVVALMAGAVLGTLLSVGATLAGLARLGFDGVVPVVPLLAYLVGTGVLVAGVVVVAVRQVGTAPVEN